jgi:hypothetical protein
MIMESVRTFIKTCPFLLEFDGFINVNVDYLGEEITTYSIEEIPCEPILKKYIGGGALKQCQFIFASREPYGSDVMQNILNSSFYEDFQNWIEEQNNLGNLPILTDGSESQEIKVLSNGYAFQVSEDKGRYQIDLRLKYLKQGGN